MKITKLLVLSALWLVGLNAQAADLIERTAPEAPSPVIDEAALAEIQKVAAEFELNKYYVLYNKGAEMYFSQGNNWATRASVCDLPILVRFTLPEGKTLEDNALYLNDYCLYNKAWKRAFFDSPTAMFVDLGSQKNFYWQVVPQGNKVYRLQASPANPDYNPTTNPGFVGRDPNVPQDDSNNDGSRNVNVGKAYPLSPFMEEGFIDWEFYEVPEWSAYGVLKDTYDAAETLKKEIATAEALGADVSAAVTVYNNESSTLEQINAAIEALKEGMSSSYTDGTGKNPKDASFLIENATFDVISDFHGWSGTAFGAGGTTSTNAEWYQAAKGADAYQDIAGLAPGYYVAGVKGFYRAGTTDDSYAHFKANDDYTKSVQFYVKANGQTYETNVCSNFKGAPSYNPSVNGQTSATDSQTGISYYVPNTMASAEVYMHKYGLYDNFVFVQVGEDKALRIGVKKSGDQLGSDWAIFDDFTLTYVGTNQDDCYPGLAWKQLQAYPDYEGEMVTQEILDAYEDVKNNDDLRMEIKDEAGYNSFMEQLTAAKALVDENVSLWKTWTAKVAEAQALIDNSSVPEAFLTELGDYVDFDAETIIEDGYVLSNEEIAEEIQKLSDWIEIANLNVAPGTDVTDAYLVNADCEKTAGWEGGPVTGSGGGNTCFEKYAASTFDVYQIVKKAPKGVYSIEVQGFFRHMRPESNSYGLYKSGEQIPYAFVYLNGTETPLKCVYDDPNEEKYSQGNDPQTNDEGVELYYPNDMTSAAEAFAAGKYKSTAYGLIVNNGDELRIGVKGKEGGSDWAIWDNFKLVYEGFTASVVQPVLEQTIATAEENLDKKMDKNLLAELKAAVEKGKAVVGSEDGEEMFKALAAISAINANESIEKFKELETANDDLVSLYLGDVPCDKATIEEAKQLHDAVMIALDNNEYTNDDVDAKMAEITTMMAKLRVPAGMANATDDTPVDCTSMIQNPDYTYGNNDGWTMTGGNPGFNVEWGLIEAYNTNFDEYQVLEGLPEGTYELSVQGFYRFGNAEKEYETYTADPSANNNLLLYTLVGDVESSVAMPRLASDGAEEHTSSMFDADDSGEPKLNEQGLRTFVAGDDIDTPLDRWQWTWMTNPVANEDSTAATGVRIANGMIPVGILFQADKFTGTSVIFKVGAEGKARIGLKKEVQEDSNWCIWDSWKLVYYGNNSAKEPTVVGIETSTANAAVVKTEFFDLSGAQIAKPNKGVAIMKQTFANGAIKVQKVIIK